MPEVRVTSCLHVEHRYKRCAYNPIENPLEGNGYGHRRTTNSVGEDLGDEHPADGSPRHHERSTVDHDAKHRHHLQPCLPEREGHTESTNGHAYRTSYQQGLASPLLHGQDCHKGKEDIDHTHDDGLHHRVLHAHITKDARRIIEHGIDTYRLLEDAEHDTHENDQHAVGEDLLRFFRNGILDIVQDISAFRLPIDFTQHSQCLGVLPGHDEITRSLGHKAYQYGKQACRYSPAAEHIAPTGLYGPRVTARSHGVDALADGLNDGIRVVA